MDMSRFVPFACSIFFLITMPVRAQFMLNDWGMTHYFTFTDFEAPITFLTPVPGTDNMDSNIWSYLASGDPATTDSSFGLTVTGGNGISFGDVSTAGVYAFNNGINKIFGIQPGSGIWTPGSLTMRLQNNTGTFIDQLEISWWVWSYNNADNSNELRFYYSADNDNYSDAGASFTHTTPETADSTPEWLGEQFTLTLTGLALNDGDFFYLRWAGDRVSGSGEDDEFGFTDLEITPIPEPSTLVLLAGGLGYFMLLRRRIAAK